MRADAAVVGAAGAFIDFKFRGNDLNLFFTEQTGAHAKIQLKPFPKRRRCPERPVLNTGPNGIEGFDRR